MLHAFLYFGYFETFQDPERDNKLRKEYARAMHKQYHLEYSLALDITEGRQTAQPCPLPYNYGPLPYAYWRLIFMAKNPRSQHSSVSC